MGFSSIIGFIFAFFTMIFVFTSIFVLYNEQLIEQIDLLESRGSEYTDSTLYNFNLNNPYYSSGRLLIELDNNGRQLKFLEENSICFSFFYDNLFFAKDKLKITVPGHIASIYNVIEEDSKGYVHLLTSKDSNDHSIKSISCGGIEEYVSILNVDKNWWDENWEEREIIYVENQASSSIVEYQILVGLNSTNFDFNLGREEELRFVVSLDQFLVADLTFDSYLQTLNEYSRYSNSAVLGTTSAIQSTDPTQLNNGVLFSGLRFDGINDLVTISDDNSLDLDEELTYAMWIKWDELGDSFQTLIKGSDSNNYFQIINDGGGNDNSLEFSLEIDGTRESVISNITIDNNWHFVTATYDGSSLDLYVDGILSGNETVIGSITTGALDTLIGTNVSNNYFNGSIDEFKIYNIALTQNEIQELYEARLRFRELEYYVQDWSGSQEQSEIYVKVPYLGAGQNISFELYYDNRDDSLVSESDLDNIFSYKAPRIIGYPVSEIAANSIGLAMLAFYNDTIIRVDSNTFSLDEMGTQTLGSGSVNQGSEIRTNKFVNVQGNGNAGDIIAPASWASTQFYASGMRGNPDTWCVLSPWGNANVIINEAGSQINGGVVDDTGTCFSNSSGTANGIEITSDIPVLVFTYGSAGNDGYVMYPATTKDIYAVGTDDLYYAGPSGSSIDWFDSDGNTGTYNIGASEGGQNNNQGSHGTAPAFRYTSTDVKSGIHQADGDGSESGVFVPENEMGYMFGSARNSEWIAIASPYPNANCSVYNSAGFVENDPSSTGANGVYKYGFDLGDNSLYEAGPWRVECDELSWGLFDDDSGGDETNMLTLKQMRQYIYPEPNVSVLS